MAKLEELITKINEETDKIWTTCPDDIKTIKYGIIGEEFGHAWGGAGGLLGPLVEMLSSWERRGSVISAVLRLSKDPDFTVEQLKKIIRALIPVGYHFRKTVDWIVDETINALDSVKTKEDLTRLLTPLLVYNNRYTGWVQFIFPWFFTLKKLTKDDIKEIARLSKTIT